LTVKGLNRAGFHASGGFSGHAAQGRAGSIGLAHEVAAGGRYGEKGTMREKEREAPREPARA
jgi:hypothetical protein